MLNKAIKVGKKCKVLPDNITVNVINIVNSKDGNIIVTDKGNYKESELIPIREW